MNKAVRIEGRNMVEVAKIFNIEVTHDVLRKWLIFQTPEIYQMVSLDQLIDNYKLDGNEAKILEGSVDVKYISIVIKS